MLQGLVAQYDVELVVHLVRPTQDDNTPEPALLASLAQQDAAVIAPYLGLSFPEAEQAPGADLKDLATRILGNMDAGTFASAGPRVSACLWQGDKAGLEALAAEFGVCADGEAVLTAGDERRKHLKHYSGAMFWYGGEWYWGVDRLSHLEDRLRALGAVRQQAAKPLAPRQPVITTPQARAGELSLEYFPSLRSPYTAVSWQPTLDLARKTGVQLKVRPVLPMVMRGVPATLEKGFYIFKDAAREARALNLDYGNFYDPIGEPVKQGYSLYMWAENQGKGQALFGSFLNAVFAKGINTTRQAGMKAVVHMAGLDWEEAKQHLSDATWEDTLEANRLSMYHGGIWGVPSYRLLDGQGAEIISAWGQDRLWLIARKIQEVAKAE